MKPVFADSSYWIAMANPRDQAHARARSVVSSLGAFRTITTDEVLGEFLTFLRRYGPVLRERGARVVRGIPGDPGIEVIAQTRASFLRGLTLYQTRLDKAHSLVDCISMATMRERGIQDALTADSHFAQEGFTPLLIA